MQYSLSEKAKSWFIIALVLMLGLTFATPFVHAIGVNKIENYVSVVKFNQGIYTEFPITTTDTLTSASHTNTGALISGGTLTVGSGSNTQTFHTSGTCNLFSGVGVTSIAATSTVTLDCQAATGAANSMTALTDVPAWALGDVVLMTMPTTTPTTFQGLRMVSAQASTTAGYIQVKIMNETGASYTLAAAATSTWAYMFER